MITTRLVFCCVVSFFSSIGPALASTVEDQSVTIDYEAGTVLLSTALGKVKMHFRYPEYAQSFLAGVAEIGADFTSDESTFASHSPPSIPPDRFTPPGPGWEWRPANEPVGGPNGRWFNPNGGESLHPDLDHPLPKGPHWGWRDPYGNSWDYFPDPAPGVWRPDPAHPFNPNRPQPTFPPGTTPTPPIVGGPVILPLVPVIGPAVPVPPIAPVRPPWFPPWLNPVRFLPIFYFDLEFLGIDPTQA